MTNFYPPILASTQMSFPSSAWYLNIAYSISNLMDSSRIGHIDIKILRQRDNSSVVSRAKYPDGIIYKAYESISNNTVFVPLDDLSISTFEEGEIYKIQLRFGYGELWGDDLSNFSEWRATQVANGYFSEWSNVQLIKIIDTPYIRAECINTATLTPTFQGICTCQYDEEEEYQFSIMEYPSIKTVDVSKWMKHTGDSDVWTTNEVLETENEYKIIYDVKFKGEYWQQYTGSFYLRYPQIRMLEGVQIAAAADNENGYNEISITLDDDISLKGNYIISRTADGKHWEDIKYYLFQDSTDDIVYRDYCIESGVTYTYGFQYENSRSLRTERNLSEKVQCHFEYSYLYRDGIQIKLEFDNTMNSFKHTVLASKQDTLGSKYPTLSRNGYAYYSEFPVNGLISLHMDEDQTFFTWNNGMYYRDSLVIPADMFSQEDEERGGESYKNGRIDHNLISPNIFIERKFREKVEEFLNDGTAKLFKSPTEGTMIVGLMNVTLAPKQELGRLVASFSATAYEIMDYTVDNLKSAGIEDVGEWTSLPELVTKKDFGQIYISSGGIDCIDAIKNQIEEQHPERTFIQLTEFSIETEDNKPFGASITWFGNENSSSIFVQPGKTYQISDLDYAYYYSIISQWPLILNYKYRYDISPLAGDKVVTDIQVIGEHYQLVNPSGTDIIQDIKDSLLDELRDTFNDDTLEGNPDTVYENSTKELKIWYLGVDWVDVEAPYGTWLEVDIGEETRLVNLGTRARRFFPYKDNITSIRFKDGAPTNGVLVETKVGIVYETLVDEVSNS